MQIHAHIDVGYDILNTNLTPTKYPITSNTVISDLNDVKCHKIGRHVTIYGSIHFTGSSTEYITFAEGFPNPYNNFATFIAVNTITNQTFCGEVKDGTMTAYNIPATGWFVIECSYITS